MDVNNVPSACIGNCDFNYDNAINPTVSGVNPTSGTLGTTLTITGTEFSTTPSSNIVLIGDSDCSVTSSTATEIQCTVGAGALGSQSVTVIVKEKGKATSSATFNYAAELTTISPTSGSIGGGIILTVTGKGFQKTDVVKVGSRVCSTLTTSFTNITCSLPAKTVRVFLFTI